MCTTHHSACHFAGLAVSAPLSNRSHKLCARRDAQGTRPVFVLPLGTVPASCLCKRLSQRCAAMACKPSAALRSWAPDASACTAHSVTGNQHRTSADTYTEKAHTAMLLLLRSVLHCHRDDHLFVCADSSSLFSLACASGVRAEFAISTA